MGGEGGGEAVDVAADLLGGEGDGSEGIFDLVGDAAGDLLPGGLLLRAEEFGGVFEDEDVAEMVAALRTAHAGGGSAFEQGDGGEEVGGAAVAVAGGHLDLGGGGAHAVGAADEAVDGFGDFGGEDLFDAAAEEGLLAAGVHHLGEGAVGEDDAAVGGEGGDAVGDGLEHGLELGAAGLEGGVGGGELDVGLVRRRGGCSRGRRPCG